MLGCKQISTEVSMRTIILTVAMLAAPFAQADIYKCKVNGQTVFSQMPCAPDAVVVQPKVVQPSAAAVAEQEAVNASVRAAASSMERSRRMGQIERAIADIDARIAQMEVDRDRTISSLRFSRNYANNNLAGATWQQSLAAEMEAVAVQYGTSISAAQAEKQRLLDEYARLRDMPQP